MTPIIIFHCGAREYAKLCINQALKFNNEIYFVTDNINYYQNNDSNLKLVNVNKYQNTIERFKKKFVNYSTNSAILEYLCILRWLVNYEVMKEFNIQRAFICDSDVLIYDNIDEIDNKYLKEKDLWLCTSPSKNVTGGQSLWSLDKLKKFSYFIHNFYDIQIKNIEKFFKTYNKPGGICDMTLLYYFCHNETEFVGLRLPNYPYYENDLTKVFNDEVTFDLHLATIGNHIDPEVYLKDNNNNKKIEFINKKPYCFNKKLNKNIRFILLHFQGRNKRIIKNYYMKS